MTIFSPDGKYGYVCSSFSPETAVIDTASKQIVGRVKQESPFCPDIAATPDGKQVWLTLKDIGKVMVFDAKPPFAVLKSFATGAITNHVNIAKTPRGQLAYVTVGTENVVKVFRTDDFTQVATIRSERCRTGYGLRATAAASMSAWRTPMRWPRSTPRRTRSLSPSRSGKARKGSLMSQARCPQATAWLVFSRSPRQARRFSWSSRVPDEAR